MSEEGQETVMKKKSLFEAPLEEPVEKEDPR